MFLLINHEFLHLVSDGYWFFLRWELNSNLLLRALFLCVSYFIFLMTTLLVDHHKIRGGFPPPHIFGKSEWFFFIFGIILSSLKFFKRTLLFLFKDVNTVPEVIPVWPLVRYISDTSQYRCTVSGLPLFFIFINKYIYIHICMYVCVCVYIYYNKYKILP